MIELNPFVFDKTTVYFRHTDFYGAVHPYYYMEWMSYAREACFLAHIPDFLEMLKQLAIVTMDIEMSFYGDAHFADRIKILMYAERIRKSNFGLRYEYYKNDSELIVVAQQTVVMLHLQSNRFARIPADFEAGLHKIERVVQ